MKRAGLTPAETRERDLLDHVTLRQGLRVWVGREMGGLRPDQMVTARRLQKAGKLQIWRESFDDGSHVTWVRRSDWKELETAALEGSTK